MSATGGSHVVIVESPDRFPRDPAVQIAGHDFPKSGGGLLRCLHASWCQNNLLASMSAALRSRRRETARRCHSAKLSFNALQSHEKSLHVLVRFRIMVLIASSKPRITYIKITAMLRTGSVTENTFVRDVRRKTRLSVTENAFARGVSARRRRRSCCRWGDSARRRRCSSGRRR